MKTRDLFFLFIRFDWDVGDVGDVINVFVLTNRIHGMIGTNTSMRR